MGNHLARCKVSYMVLIVSFREQKTQIHSSSSRGSAPKYRLCLSHLRHTPSSKNEPLGMCDNTPGTCGVTRPVRAVPHCCLEQQWLRINYYRMTTTMETTSSPPSSQSGDRIRHAAAMICDARSGAAAGMIKKRHGRCDDM